MAQTSGQFSGSIHSGNQQLIVQWTATQDIANNKSIITANMYLKSSAGLSIGTRNNSTTIDGTVKNYTSGTISKNSAFNVLVGTVSQDVSHNSDGTKTISMSSVFNIQATLGGTYYASITANSGNIELPTIPRASSITVNDANIGSATNIVINKTSSNFTTTLYYKASGESSWTKIVDKTSNQVYGWTVPTSFYVLIPNSKNITCQFKAETFNGNTSLGTTTTTATFTATGNPVIDSFTAEDVNETTADLTGDSTKMIKGFSEIEFNYTAHSINSAYIKKTTLLNSTATYQSTTTIDEGEVIGGVSTNIFKLTVIDTRDYQAAQEITMPMVNYIPLTLNPVIARNTPTDEKVNISFSGNYFNDTFGAQNNTLTVQYRYKESTSSTWGSWTTISHTKSGNTYNGSTQLSNMDYQKIYNFEMRATDKIGTKQVVGITVAKGEPIYWWDNDEFHVNTKLYYGSNGRQDYSDAGFEYDGYGNMKHRRSTNTDTWNIKNNSGTAKLVFNPETGLLNVIGNIQKNGSNVATTSDVPTKTSDLTNDSNFMVSDFMIAGNSSQQTISGNNTPQKYNLNTNIASSGNKLTFNSSNHSIDIGSGISYVEVSAQVYMMDRGSNSIKILTIRKNDVQIVRCTMPTNYNNQTISIPSTIIPVQQNDKLTLYIQNSAGNSTFGDNTSSQPGINFLTVKVIK